MSLPSVLTQFKILLLLDGFFLSFPSLSSESLPRSLPYSNTKALLSLTASAPFQPPCICTSCFSLCTPCALLHLEAPCTSFWTQVPSLCLCEISLAPQAVCGSLQFVHFNTLYQTSLVTQPWPVVPVWWWIHTRLNEQRRSKRRLGLVLT